MAQVDFELGPCQSQSWCSNHSTTELNLNIMPLTTTLLFGYKNQNQDKFKIKTFFRDYYNAALKQNQFLNVTLELRS